MDEYVTIYDQQGRLTAVLENAFDVSCELVHNDLWTGGFSLPAADPKNEACTAFSRVRLPTAGRDAGLYRIIASPERDEANTGDGAKRYTLEHVAATLMDDMLFGYHEIGGPGITTRDVAAYILARQSVKLWELGDVEFDGQFAYKFENQRLLPALLSLGNVLSEPYTWDFDTSASPWRVSLRRADSAPGCGIHYLRNLQEIRKEWDATDTVTRLYLLGYGEGVNQLTVKSVNGGLPYIDADTLQALWPPKCGVFTDTRIEDAGTLLARGRAVLDAYKEPYVCYTARAADLSRLTGFEWDRFMPGKLVRVLDGEHGIDFAARIEAVSLPDLTGAPDDAEITIANKPRDAADSMNALADRVGIGELYSQGATNLYSQQYADNADAQHPARMRVYVPAGCVRINQMLLSWELSAFRAYETGAAAGGATVTTTATGGASVTTSGGGGASERTSQSGGAYTATVVSRTVAEIIQSGSPMSDGSVMNNTGSPRDSGGGGMTQTDEAGSHSHSGPTHLHNLNDHRHSVASGVTQTGTPSPVTTVNAGGSTSTNGGHTHGMYHTHPMTHVHNVNVAVTVPGQDITVPAHSHVFTTPSHTHSVEVPEHSHSLTLQDHTHEIQYGIYEGGAARNVALRVDGNPVPAEETQRGETDVVPYLDKDEDGRITRGAWHEIELVPDALTRIEASLFVQAFVQSVGGGDF